MFGRGSYEYPQGKPKAVRSIETAIVVFLLAFFVLVLLKTPWAVAVWLMLVAAFVISSILDARYAKAGQAVWRQPSRTSVAYPNGLPAGTIAGRVAFLAVVVVMMLFGYLPLSDKLAHNGMIGCVFALIAVAVANVALERHHVKAGKATEVEKSAGS